MFLIGKIEPIYLSINLCDNKNDLFLCKKDSPKGCAVCDSVKSVLWTSRLIGGKTLSSRLWSRDLMLMLQLCSLWVIL